MRLEFIGKTRAKVADIGPHQEKMGQKETRSCAKTTLTMSVPNTVLDQLGKGLREVWFQKPVMPAKQADLSPMVEDKLVELTTNGKKMGGGFSWDDTMTGATLRIYHGIADTSKIDFIGVKVDKLSAKCVDGIGACELKFDVLMYDIDEETAGELFLMHTHEIDIELIPPTVDGQLKLPPPDADEPITPVKALKAALKKPPAAKKPAKAPAKGRGTLTLKGK